MEYQNQKPISEIREEQKTDDKARIAQLEADLLKEREDKLTAMEAIAELYEMFLIMG